MTETEKDTESKYLNKRYFPLAQLFQKFLNLYNNNSNTLVIIIIVIVKIIVK